MPVVYSANKFGFEMVARYRGIVLMQIRNDGVLQELAKYVEPSQHPEKKVRKQKGGQPFHTQSTVMSGEEHAIFQKESETLAEFGFDSTVCKHHSLPLKKRVNFNNFKSTSDNGQNELHQNSLEKFDSKAIINPHPWGAIFSKIPQQHRTA